MSFKWIIPRSSHMHSITFLQLLRWVVGLFPCLCCRHPFDQSREISIFSPSSFSFPMASVAEMPVNQIEFEETIRGNLNLVDNCTRQRSDYLAAQWGHIQARSDCIVLSVTCSVKVCFGYARPTGANRFRQVGIWERVDVCIFRRWGILGVGRVLSGPLRPYRLRWP